MPNTKNERGFLPLSDGAPVERAPCGRTAPPLARTDALEVLLAIAVLGVLASVVVPNYSQYMERGRNTQAMADLRTIELAIFRFSVEQNGRFPESLAEVGVIQSDPWGRPYQYLNVMTTRNRGHVRKDRSLNPINTDYDLYSMGPDGRSVSPLTAAHSHDDIVRGRNGQFIGKAVDF